MLNKEVCKKCNAEYGLGWSPMDDTGWLLSYISCPVMMFPKSKGLSLNVGLNSIAFEVAKTTCPRLFEHALAEGLEVSDKDACKKCRGECDTCNNSVCSYNVGKEI